MESKNVIIIAFIAIATVTYFITPVLLQVYYGNFILHAEHASLFAYVYTVGVFMLDRTHGISVFMKRII